MFQASLKSIINQTDNKYRDSLEETLDVIMSFMTERFRNIMITEGFAQDVVDAVVSVEFNDILDAKRKIQALSEFRKAKDFESLGTAFKRVVNIVKDHTGNNFSERHLVELVEKELFKAFHEVKDKVEVTISEKNYIDSLTLMKNLKDPVDKFFDNVMVMDKDPKIRENRLSMLSEIKNLFFKIADFSKLSV